MKKLLNLNEKENKTKYFTLKCRREMIKLAAFAPDVFRNLCINFENEKSSDFIAKIKNNTQVLQFLKKSEKLIQSRIFYTGVNYSEIFNSIFGYDEKYLANATELEKVSGYYCLRYLYIVLNYINDNFPVIAVREMNFEEKRLIKFLLYTGDEEDFMAQYGVDEVLVKGICENYRCNNINTALNLILIEKYLKGENRTFIKVIDVLK